MGKKNNLNPILYLSDNSSLSTSISNILTVFKKEELQNIKHLEEAKRSYLKILRYLKPYKGDFLRGDTLIDNVKFYNEREWRFVPEWANGMPWISKIDFEDPIKRAQENEKLKAKKLSFEPKDIAYIIVKEEKEIYSMIKALKEIKEKYDTQTIEILNSRIITYEQISHDF